MKLRPMLAIVGGLLTTALTSGAANTPAVDPFYGSFGTDVPITVPVFKGIEPDMKLVYNSTASNGLMGQGWALSGFSRIERFTRGRGAPNFDANDVFYLDGDELVPCAAGSKSPSCLTGGTHSTRIENYMRIKYDSTAGSWSLWRKDGTVSTYAPLGTPVADKCTTTPVTASGNVMTGPLLQGLRCSGNVITPVGTGVTGSITLGGGATCSGSFDMGPFGADCFQTVRTDGTRLTFASSTGTQSLTFSGTTLAGSADPGCSSIGLEASGSTITIWGGEAVAGQFTLGGNTTCVPAPFGGIGQWGISQIRDTRSNTVSYGWKTIDGYEYPNAVTYNGNTVQLYWEPRTDSLIDTNGGRERRISQRLRSVLVKVGASKVRAYRVRYTTSTATKRSLVAGIAQYGSDVAIDAAGAITGGTSLPELTASYNTPALNIGATDWTVLDWTGLDWATVVPVAGDFNGDGKTDLYVHATKPGKHEYMGLSTGAFLTQWTWDGAVDWSNYNITPADINGDGKTDLYLHSKYQAFADRIALSTGTAFTLQAWTSPLWGTNRVVLGDYNGDGKTDVVVQNTSGPSEMWVSTGTSFSKSAWVGPNGASHDFYAGDYNGDGQSDLLAVASATLPSPGTNLLYISVANGLPNVASGSNNADWRYFDIVPGDYNGDGRQDIFLHGAGEFGGGTGNFMALSHGTGFDLWAWQSPASVLFKDYVAVGGDYNGDGRSDILFHARFGKAVADKIALSSGNSFNLFDWTLPTGTWSGFGVTPGDYNGDGRTDLFLPALKAGLKGFLSFSKGAPGTDLLSSIANGMGGSTTVGYTPSSAWVNGQLPTGMVTQTASSLTTTDGRGASGKTTYQFEGGLWSYPDRRFLGFRKVTAAIDTKGNYTETYYHQHTGCIAKPESTYFKDSTGKVYSYSTYEYTENNAAPYTSLLTGRWDYQCELGPTADCRKTRLEMDYDEYANLLTTREFGDYNVGAKIAGTASATGDERSRVVGYFPNKTAYIVGLKGYENLYRGLFKAGTANTGVTLQSQALYVYDSQVDYLKSPVKGLITKVRRWNNLTGGFSDTTYAHDVYGNITTETDATGVARTIEYDATYHQYPTRECKGFADVNADTKNDLCSSTAWNYLFGTVQSVTDANAAVTGFTYDALGRPSQVNSPTGGQTAFSYVDWGNPQKQKTREKHADGSVDGLWTESYVDGLGRKYKTMARGGAEGNIVVEYKYSDTSARVWQESLPYYVGATPKWKTYGYDGAGRKTLSVNPDGTSAAVTYTAKAGVMTTTTTNENGIARSVVSDGLGRPAKVIEKNKNAAGTVESYTTTYTYDVSDRVVRIADHLGNPTTFTFDSLGRRTENCSPDWGCTTYTFDAVGRMLTQKNQAGDVLTYTYEAKTGRPKSRLSGSVVLASYTYDEKNHGASIGRMTTIVDTSATATANPSESFTYDAEGQVTTQRKCIGTKCVSLSQTFDVAGRVKTIAYPQETITYGYDPGGRLSTISNYVTGAKYNASGQLLSMTYANGVTEAFTYDSNRAWLDTATVTGPTSAASPVLYDASYTHDSLGLVKSYTSPTGKFTGWDYKYDDLGRLTTATNRSNAGYTQTFKYDAIGRMTYNSKRGTYKYEDPSHVHAVTNDGVSSYVHDEMGQRQSGNGLNYVWNVEGRLDSIVKGGATTTFDYDHKGARVSKTAGGVTTYYFSPLVEETAGVQTMNVFAGARMISRKVGTTKSFYHGDQVGSVRLMTDATGKAVNRYEYAPFGGTLVSTQGTPNQKRFGGHTADDESGLVYMNARYYDPTTARFVSPDSVIPDTGNPQALDAYAFVYNNPISNADPTGHAPVAAVFVAITAFLEAYGAYMLFAGALMVIVGMGLNDSTLIAIGSIMMGAGVGGTTGLLVSTATSPISPLDPGIKQAVGWIYTAYCLVQAIGTAAASMTASSESSVPIRLADASKAMQMDTQFDIPPVEVVATATPTGSVVSETVAKSAGAAVKAAVTAPGAWDKNQLRISGNAFIGKRGALGAYAAAGIRAVEGEGVKFFAQAGGTSPFGMAGAVYTGEGFKPVTTGSPWPYARIGHDPYLGTNLDIFVPGVVGVQIGENGFAISRAVKMLWKGENAGANMGVGIAISGPAYRQSWERMADVIPQ